MRTLSNLISDHGVDVHQHLDREELVPVSNGLQRQGDIIVVPDAKVKDRGKAVPREGVAVVRGEAGGNTHLLLADGEVFWKDLNLQDGTGQLDIGVLTVPKGATGYLAHPEHGYAGIAPGTYTIRRQREQADEIRMVAD